MKRGRCPRCQASAIGRLDALPDVTSAADPLSYEALGSIGYQPARLVYVKGGNYTTPDLGKPPRRRAKILKSRQRDVTKAETIEAYLCATCGYLERYLQEPQWAGIPERLEGFRWAKYASEEEHVNICVKCNSSRIGKLDWLPDTQRGEHELEPRHIGVQRQGKRRSAVGRLSALICADCGYLESYVADVKQLPLEQLEGFSWLEGPGAPYR